MLCCILIEIVIGLWIVNDIIKITKKEYTLSKISNRNDLILMFSLFFLFVIIFIFNLDSSVLGWLNAHRNFYLLYLISMLIFTILEAVLYKKMK